MSMTKPGIVLALCVLSQTLQGAEVRRTAPSGQVRAVTPTFAVKRTATVGGLKVLRPAPDTNERPKRTDKEKEFAAAAALMARYKEWMIGANVTGFVYPNNTGGPSSRKYNLKGTAVVKFLQYEKQGTFGGINLGWTKTASAQTAIDRAQWIFRRPGGPSAQSAPVVYGEPIALGWAKVGKQFLKFSKRNAGINLDWSDGNTRDPSFEWTILGRTPGTRVRRGQDLVTLYNLRHMMPMMYVDRSRGGHIGFAPDSDSAYVMSLRNAANVMMGK